MIVSTIIIYAFSEFIDQSLPWNKMVISAKQAILAKSVVKILIMQIVKRRGPRTVPGSTPALYWKYCCIILIVLWFVNKISTIQEIYTDIVYIKVYE